MPPKATGPVLRLFPVYEAGVDGQGIRFYRDDGDYVTIPDSEDFFNFYSEGLTVNMWYLPDDYAGLGGWQNLVQKRASQNADGWMIFEMSNTYGGGYSDEA